MKEVSVTINNNEGLHARPASVFTKMATKWKSDIKIMKDEKEYNAKSILGILTMNAKKGTVIKIIGNGPDENEAIEELKELVENNFYE